jgi:hypothetical protein
MVKVSKAYGVRTSVMPLGSRLQSHHRDCNNGQGTSTTVRIAHWVSNFNSNAGLPPT